MRDIDTMIIHCSDTPEGRVTSVSDVTSWHVNPKDYYDKNKKLLYVKYKGKKYKSREDLTGDVKNKHGRGWSDIGYHYLIHLDGHISRGRPVEKVGAHCYGKNSNSIGVCYVGGKDSHGKEIKDTRTHEQKHALKIIVERYKDKYPEMTVHGHDEFSSKACPSFDVQQWLINEKL